MFTDGLKGAVARGAGENGLVMGKNGGTGEGIIQHSHNIYTPPGSGGV